MEEWDCGRGGGGGGMVGWVGLGGGVVSGAGHGTMLSGNWTCRIYVFL